MSGWSFLALSLLGLQAALAWFPRVGLPFLPYTLGGSGLLLLVGGLGAFALRGDVQAFYLGLLGSLYVALGPYLGPYLAHHPWSRARLEAFLFPLFMGALVGVVLAPPGYPFLFLWEGMALLGFLLIALEGPEALGGSQAFFLASRLSGVGLFLAFLFHGQAPLALVWAGLLLGFGTKAGLFPLHPWLPRAHPVAISPLSALLSGGMVKLGLYGLYRSSAWFAPLPSWVGWVLVLLGLSGAVYALVRGLAERDFKGILAYSSVENLNLLLAALGGYFLTQSPLFLGAFFYHQLAHALFKGLLFLASGLLPSRNLDALGGLWTRLPRTAPLVLLGVWVGAGLPPLAGFLGEWLLYLGFLQAKGVLALGVGLLALVGALAGVLYLRLFGLAFLGVPRSPEAEGVQEEPLGMRLGLGALALVLLFLSLFPSPFLRPLGVAPYPVLPLALALGLLAWGVLLWLRARPRRVYRTWDCGYDPLTPAMQPNALGFSEQLLRLFPFAPLRVWEMPGRGGYPPAPRVRVEVPDLLEQVLAWGARGYAYLAWGVRRLQSGSVHLYLLLQFLALLLVLGVSR